MDWIGATQCKRHIRIPPKETGGAVECEKLDLASLASVRECAQTLLDREDKIDILGRCSVMS